MKNTHAVIKEWMDKDEALWLGSKLGLDPNGELKSISSINMTHLSLEEALDEINLRYTNPWEILDNKLSNDCHRHGTMETMVLPIDIHEETLLELEKEDDIDVHGSYIMNTSSNPCSYEKSPESIDLSTTMHEIFNPLMLSVHKDFERVVINAYVYHKYCRSRCVNLEIDTRRLVLEGKPLHQFKVQLESFPRTSFCPKISSFERYHELAPSAVMPL
jgi:hypothetical protein